VAAFGPLLVGAASSTEAALSTLFYIGFVPVIGLLAMPWILETRGRALADE
jgi:hypothetical protein